MKSLVGDIPLLAGVLSKGAHLKIGYFSQHQVDDLKLDLSALNHIQLLNREVSEQSIRTYLGGFNFKGDN